MTAKELFAHRAKKPLRQILWESLSESLPKEVRFSASYRWLVSHDHFRDGPSYAEESSFREREFRWLFSRRQESRTWDREALLKLLQPIASSSLSPVLQFRYRQGIELGRRWRNIKTRQQWIHFGQVPQNLKRTVATNLDRLRAAGAEVAEDELRVDFSRYLRDAQELAKRDLDGVRVEFRSWDEDVQALRQDVEAVEQELDGLDGSEAFGYAWIRFATIRATHGSEELSGSFDISQMLPTMLVGMMANSRDRGLKHSWYRFENMLRTLDDEVRFGPARRRQIAALEQRYRGTDPFGVYAPLMRPADRELIGIVEEHTMVDQRPSVYLRAWLRRLTRPPNGSSSYVEPMPFRSFDDVKAVERSADWADSSIKLEIGSGPWPNRRPRGWESMDEFVRRIWISDWVEWVVNNLNRKKGDEKQPDSRWTRETVFAYVEAVRERLSDQGYAIDELSGGEKDKLWNR